MLRYPVPPRTALAHFSARAPVPSVRDTNAWNRVLPEVRAGAFFSARVEDARFLDRAKKLIEDNISGARGADGRVKVGSKSAFVDQMREFMVAEGMVSPGEYGPALAITNLSGSARLKLIFDTNVRQSHNYASYAQGLDPLILDRWPAAEFVRLEDPYEPRPRHVAGEGDIRLKTDLAYWADWQNGYDIGGFGLPWGPYGFNSLMGQEDRSRATAESLNLLYPGQPAYSEESERLRQMSPNTTLQASTKSMDRQIARALEESLREADDRNYTGEQMGEEDEARDRERLLYNQMDALNATGAPPGEIDRVERQLQEIDERRESRGTRYIFRIRRGVGGLLRFLGDRLFRRG